MRATNKPEKIAIYEILEDRTLIHFQSGGLSIEWTTDLKEVRKIYKGFTLRKKPAEEWHADSRSYSVY